MAITRERLVRLEREASPMATANHGRYLSEAMQAMRDPASRGDGEAEEREAPLRALRLLSAMWGTPFAPRPDQRAALNDVGVWLETRLVREPKIAAMSLLVELGWLKRLSRHFQGAREEEPRASYSSPARAAQRSFGNRLAELERKRRDAHATARVHAVNAQVPAAPTKPKAEEPLPETMAVVFAHFNAAREVRKAAADRAKRGKAPRDTTLELGACGNASPGVKLICSTTRTEGITEVFERIRRTPGAPDWHIQAEGLAKQADGTVFVGRMAVREGT